MLVFKKKLVFKMLSIKFSVNIFKSIFLRILFLLILVSSAQAQNKNEFADSLSTVLQKKLLLDNSQKLEIKNILINYINEPENVSSTENTHRKISEVLDKRQKAKFDIIKNEFWHTINKKRQDSKPKK